MSERKTPRTAEHTPSSKSAVFTSSEDVVNRALANPQVTSLPIASSLEAIRSALRDSGIVVVQAPPGAGKSTVVPLALLGSSTASGYTGVTVLQPRRVAARAIAARMASLIDERVGETVGYSVRFERRVSAETRIEVVTEGLLVRRIQEDLELAGTGTVIIDEFHERSLNADLSLALLLDLRRSLRPDLQLVIMSATLNSRDLLALLGPVPFIDVPGRSYPVKIEYLADTPQSRLADTAAQGIKRALAQGPGDILAFLPGLGEIRATREILERDIQKEVVIEALYGELPLDKQQAILSRGESAERRVILATPVAETSLTVEGVRIVVDSGLRRAVRFDPAYGMDRVTTEQITRDAADQRAGRAGRQGPGICFRLWTEGTNAAARASRSPEILELDLCSLVLNLSAWGVSDPSSLNWIDPPPAGGVAAARAVLQSLGALDDSLMLTPRGRTIASLPTHPRTAAMLLDSAGYGLTDLGCNLAALLDERDPFPPSSRPGADIELRLELLTERGRGAQSADRNVVERIKRLSRELRSLTRSLECTDSTSNVSPGVLLASAYPERVARRRGTRSTAQRDGIRYLLATGTSVMLDPSDPLVTSEWLVVPHLGLSRGEATAYLACRLSPDEVLEHLSHRIRSEESTRLDPEKGQLISEIVTSIGAIVLSRKRIERSQDGDAAAVIVAAIREAGLLSLRWSPESSDWKARAETVRRFVPDSGIPDLSDNVLLESLDLWLVPFLSETSCGPSSIDPLPALKSYVGWNRIRSIDELAPHTITLPGGKTRSLSYSPASGAVLAATVQELFGWKATPALASGRIPLTLEILSPAKRPVQITKDLESFWMNGYRDVRKELRGRYPKHSWPEDGKNAAPIQPRKR